MTNKRVVASNGLVVWVSASAVVLVLLGWMLLSMADRGGGPGSDAKELKVYCAAGIRLPMQEIAKQYEAEYGVKIVYDFNGSGTLLSSLKVAKSGDLYLAADDSYIQMAQEAGLVREEIPLAKMRPVILVPKDNPLKIKGIDDLLSNKVRVALGNPDQAAIGKKTRKLLRESKQWEKLNQNVKDVGAFLPTVNELATAVDTGSVNAAIVWDATAAQYPKLKAINTPELDAGTASITFGVLESSGDRATEALRFARYVGAKDKGLKVFQANGYEIFEGDIWEEKPELTFFAGAVNKRALEPILQKFEDREGVTVNTTFEGCGILTGTMKGIEDQDPNGGFPDIFMACDKYYLEVVQDWFQKGTYISDTDIVIAVPKGNPANIKKLSDLANPGVKVAVGQPKQCTIGVLTRKLFVKENLLEAIKKNVVTETTSSSLLVPAVIVGQADATLAYRTDCMAEKDKLEIIPIESEYAKAIQPYSISLTSQKKQLARRLYETIAQSRDQFQNAGFNWKSPPATLAQ